MFFGGQILVFGQNSLFAFPVEENAPRAKKTIMSRGDSGERGRAPITTCGTHEPGKVLSSTPLCRWLLWLCLALASRRKRAAPTDPEDVGI